MNTPMQPTATGPAEHGAHIAYEPPQLQVLGTLEELTQGIVPITTDGIAPGSAL